jgi:23S rRNA pseudouridine2605 synthase
MKRVNYSTPNPQLPVALVRLNKVIAQRAGIARRKADDLISAGRVSVNGKAVRVLGTKILLSDKVSIDNKELNEQVEKLVVYRFYKPKGVVSTMQDEQNRPSIGMFIPDKPSVFPVGRLDQSSEGLLILTNDGELALHLSHPRYRKNKTYSVWIHKLRSYSLAKINADLLRRHLVAGKLRAFDSVVYRGIDENGIKFDVTLHEGVYHEVKRLIDRAGYTVARLVRIQQGSLNLGLLQPGQFELLTDREYAQLRLDM